MDNKLSALLFGKSEDSPVQRRYRSMRSIRRFEERLLELFDQGLLRGTTHCAIGQEANAVGVLEHLSPEDHVFSNHRCHGHYLATCQDVLGLLTEIMGLPQGLCGGIGGSQHLHRENFQSNGVLGGTLATASGIAWAQQLDSSSGISIVFLGDGALAEGIIYESLNIARLWQLPLLIVVEDNAWSQSTPKSLNRAGTIPGRFAAFDIPCTAIETTDVDEIYQAAGECFTAVRSGSGPQALVIDTYRLCHHSKNDDHRPKEEVEARKALDPLRIYQEKLTADAAQTIYREVETALETIFQEALQQP